MGFFGNVIHCPSKRKQGENLMNKQIIQNFINTVNQNIGVGNKDYVANTIESIFHLNKKGAIYYCGDFAVRFCSTKSKTDSVSNTVMALKHIKAFDSIPLFVCVVGSNASYIRLANATFIKKVSHSSKNLREDNIVGNINYSDIMRNYAGIDNTGSNWEQLFEIHNKIDFANNLQRIVCETNNIVPSGKRFVPTEEQRRIILEAPDRAYDFILSNTYSELKADLDEKTKSAEADIQLIEMHYSHDVKLRGNLVEYFIKSSDEKHKKELRKKIENNEVIEDLTVENGLGDYSVKKDGYSIETDIKSKVTKLSSAPKGYNVDKLLEFLSDPTSIYLLYIVAMNGKDKPLTELTSIFQEQILDKTRIQHHWAGRNSRGVAQFEGQSLEYFVDDDNIRIEIEKAKSFLRKLLDDNPDSE